MRLKQTALQALLVLGVFGTVSVAPVNEHHLHAQAARPLPPLQYSCPHHPEVLQDKPGTCPQCKMVLEPTRIDSEFHYSCPDHPVIVAEKPGICPIDRRRELVPVVVTLHWTCKQNPDERLMDPGTCADGAIRQLVKQIRAHGDHNPRHGGSFFMAQDQWHHLEGTYPRAGLFRAFFYDNYTQPMAPRNFTGRIVTREEFDYAAKTNKELESFPLRLSKDGKTLEADLKNVKPPSKEAPTTMVMKVRLTKDGPEQSFTFAFVEYSKEPVAAPAATTTSAPPAKPASSASTATTTGAAANKPAPAATAAPAATTSSAAPPTPPPAAAQPAGPAITNCEPNMARTDALLLSDSLPRNAKALLNLLGMCGDEVQKLVQASQFGFIYQPTMLGKDIALALEGHVTELPESRRPQASDAIRRTVLAAWQLDMFGDMGNQERITEAYGHFAAAIAAVKTAYAAQP
jgi:hypothetical protein